jgi:glycogen synthase
MRIIQLGPFPPPNGGVQTNLVAIREHLRAKGIPSGVINLTRYRRADGDGVFYPDSGARTARMVLRLPARILHLHIGGTLQLRGALLGLFCSWLPGRKSVLTFHSGGYPASPEGLAAKPASWRGFLFRQFDRIIVVNPELVDVMLRYGVRPDRVRLIAPHTVNLSDMAPALTAPLRTFTSAHTPLLVTLSGLEPEYDLALQIDAFGEVLKSHPDAGLAILGSGSLEQDLRRRIQGKPYRDSISLAGDVPHGVALRAIEQADLFLRTTLYDGDAVSVREALVLGTPVIATDNGMRPPGPRLIPVSDPVALVAAIEEQLSRDTRPVRRLEQTGTENLDLVLDLYRELDPELGRPPA